MPHIVAKKLGIELTDKLKNEIKEKAITRVLNRHSISHNELEIWFDVHKDFSNNFFQKILKNRFNNNIDQRKTLIEIATTLIYAHANPNVQTESGKTLLMNAAGYKYKDLKDIIELLLICGANPNMQDGDGHTALMLAAFFGNKDTVELLLNAGAEPNIHDKKGFTALMRGIFYWPKDVIVEFFLSEGEEIKIRKSYSSNFSASTPTDFFLNIRHEEEVIERLCGLEREMVKCFLNVGVELNLDLKDRNDCTILMKKIYKRYKNIIVLLLNAGADPNIQDKNGHTVL